MAVGKKVLMSMLALLCQGVSSVWASSSSDELHAQTKPLSAAHKHQRLADALLDELLSDPLPIISNLPQNPTELIPYLGKACASIISEGTLLHIQNEAKRSEIVAYPRRKKFNPEARYVYGEQSGKIKDLVPGTPAHTAVVQELVRRMVYEELFSRFKLEVYELLEASQGLAERPFERQAFPESVDALPEIYAHMVQVYKTLRHVRRSHLQYLRDDQSIQAYLEDDYESITSHPWQDQEGSDVHLKHLFVKDEMTNSLKLNIRILQTDGPKILSIHDALKQSLKSEGKGLERFLDLLRAQKMDPQKWPSFAKNLKQASTWLNDELAVYETVAAALQSVLRLKSFEPVPGYRSPFALSYQAIGLLIGEMRDVTDYWSYITRGVSEESRLGFYSLVSWDELKTDFSLRVGDYRFFSGALRLMIYQGQTLEGTLYMRDLNWREHESFIKPLLRRLLLRFARQEWVEKHFMHKYGTADDICEAVTKAAPSVRKGLNIEEKKALLVVLDDFYQAQKTVLTTELEKHLPELASPSSVLCEGVDLDAMAIWNLVKDSDPSAKLVFPCVDEHGCEQPNDPKSIKHMIMAIKKPALEQQKEGARRFTPAEMDQALKVTLNKITLTGWMLQKAGVNHTYSQEQLDKDCALAQKRVKDQLKALDEALWGEATTSKKSSNAHKAQKAQKTQQQPKADATKTSKVKEKTKDSTPLAIQPAAKVTAVTQAKAGPSAALEESRQASSVAGKTPQETAPKAQASLPQPRNEAKVQVAPQKSTGDEESLPASVPNFLTPTPQEVQQLDSLRQEISRWKQSYTQAVEEKNKAQQQLILRDAELSEKTQRLDHTQKRLHKKTVLLGEIQKTVADQEEALKQLTTKTERQTTLLNACEAELVLKTEQVQSLEQQLQQKNADLQTTQLQLAQALESSRAAQAYAQYVRDLQEQNALLLDACRGTLAAHTDIVRVSKMVTGLDDDGLIQALKNMKTGKMKPADVQVEEPRAPAKSKATKRNERNERKAKQAHAANMQKVYLAETTDEHQTLQGEQVVQAEQASESSK